MNGLDDFLRDWRGTVPWLRVHTSGSTGAPKELVVEKRRMAASARITCERLGLHAGDTALLCLPLDYIAGKMMVVRAETCGLRLLSVEPTSHPLAAVGDSEHIDFAAMVPLQVWQTLRVAEERARLARIGQLIIGGGAVDEALEAELRTLPCAAWSTYGMTETLSHVALRRLNGPEASAWYRPLAGVTVALSSEGCLVVSAPAVCADVLVTRDRAVLEDDGDSTALRPVGFRILGRQDNVVCSGGVKIQMEEVERLLRPHLSMAFCTTRRRDPALGEALVLLYEGGASEEALRAVCRQVLPPYWQPRHYLRVDALPTTPNGKIARQEAERVAEGMERN